MFEIFSVGDAAFLEQILIAVSTVTSMGSFEKMVSVGLLLGVIMMFVQSIFQGAKQINFQQVLLGYLLYAILFVPTVTVVIEDSYTGQVRVVDNVPLGIGGAGGIISSVGYNITNLFEQGYGTIVPYITESHFAESLTILNNTRRLVHSTPVYTAMNVAVGGDADMRKSWSNYIRECSLTAIDLGKKSVDDMMAGELPQVLRFKSNLYGTKLYLGSARGTDYTCSEAYSLLTEKTDSAINSDQMSNVLLNLLHVDNAHTGTGQDYITTALGSLGVTSTSGTTYLTAAVLKPIYNEAAQGRYLDFQDTASAIMVNQAIQQRNTQWAAEQSMFMTIARPMMTFFEGFVYAITPLMAFLIVLGSFGMGLAVRYFQTLLWIQLWMPVMSIINLYIYTAASNEMASLGSNLTSIYALNSASDQLQHWIATGGMLAAATPIISLFVVSGSTYTFTSLAGRVSGKDHIDEKIQSKDLVDNGPLMQTLASYEYTDLGGRAASGASQSMGSISLGVLRSARTSSARVRMSEAKQTLSNDLNSNFSHDTMSSEAHENANVLGRMHSAKYGKTEGVVNELAKQAMEATSLGPEHTEQVKGLVTASATNGFSLKALTMGLFDLSASTSIQGDKSTTDANSSKREMEASLANVYNRARSERSEVLNELSQSVTTGDTKLLSQTLGQQKTKSLIKSSQNAISTSDSYSKVNSMDQQYGRQTNISVRNLASQMSGNDQAMSDMENYWLHGGVKQDTKDEASRLYKRYRSPADRGGYGLDHKTALAAARINALYNSKNHKDTDDRQYGDNVNAVDHAMSTTLGVAIGRVGGYDSNAKLEQVSNSGLNANVQNGVYGVKSAVAGANAITMPQSGNPAPLNPASLTSTPGIIANEVAVNSAALRGRAADWNSSRNAEAEAGASRKFRNGKKFSHVSAAALYARGEKFSDWIGSGAIAAKDGTNVGLDKLDELLHDSAFRKNAISNAKMKDAELKSSGVGGKFLSGINSAGRSLIGVIATGIEMAEPDSGISFDDIKGLPLEEKAVVYKAALIHAAENGHQATVRTFNEKYGKKFRESFHEAGMLNGLTHEQAQVYAHSMGGSRSERQAAIQGLAATYAKRDAQGNMMRDDNGAPVLTKQAQKTVDCIVDTLTASTQAGSKAGSYMIGIAQYNLETGRREQSSSVVDTPLKHAPSGKSTFRKM